MVAGRAAYHLEGKMRLRADIARVPLLQRPKCFMDLETTGRKAGWNEVTEVGFVHDKLGEWSCRVKPKHMNRAEQAALEMQGFKLADWEDAPTFDKIARRFIEFTENAILIGHNIAGFDIPMAKGNFEMCDLSHAAISHAVVDTMTIAITQLVPKGLKTLRLAAICDLLKISNEGEHTALADALRAKAVYEKTVGNQLSLF